MILGRIKTLRGISYGSLSGHIHSPVTDAWVEVAAAALKSDSADFAVGYPAGSQQQGRGVWLCHELLDWQGQIMPCPNRGEILSIAILPPPTTYFIFSTCNPYINHNPMQNNIIALWLSY